VKLFSLLLVAMNLATAMPRQTLVPKQPFTLVISTEKSTVKAGAPVTILLRVTNTSDHDMPPGFWGQNRLGVDDFTDVIEVRDSHGRSLMKRKVDPADGTIGNGMDEMMITPGKTREYVQDYSRWYDLSRPDVYTIQVLRPFSENGKKGTVKSNKLSITITPSATN
jgi:hypothetical protein